MSTKLQIANSIRDFLNDQGYFYNSDDINNSLQDGYDEVAAASGCIEKMVAIPFTLNTVYYDLRTLISDFVCLVGIYNRRVKRWMTPCSCRELDQLRSDWELATGEPFAFWPVNYRYMAIYPAINAVGTVAINYMYIVYKAAADTLADSTEPAIPLPIQGDILEEYTLMDMYEQAEEWTKASLSNKHYLEKHDELRVLIEKRDQERLVRLGGNL